MKNSIRFKTNFTAFGQTESLQWLVKINMTSEHENSDLFRVEVLTLAPNIIDTTGTSSDWELQDQFNSYPSSNDQILKIIEKRATDFSVRARTFAEMTEGVSNELWQLIAGGTLAKFNGASHVCNIEVI